MNLKNTVRQQSVPERIRLAVFSLIPVSFYRIFNRSNFKTTIFYCIFSLINLFLISALSAQVVQTITTSGNFVVPAGCTSLKIETWGAGGGGGAASATLVAIASGGGGGGGAYNSSAFTVIPGQTYTITIGAGGTAGLSSTNGGNGGSGGATTVSGDAGTVTANGGGGGGGAAAIILGTTNGAAGVGATGLRNGGAGQAGQGNTSGVGGGGAGNAGNGGTPAGGIGSPNVSPYVGGTGAAGVTGSNVGTTGGLAGGGGSGGHIIIIGNRNGGPGRAGRVVLTYCVSPTAPSAGTITSTNPSACGNFTGSITLSGYTASTSYKLQYTKNAIPYSFAILSNALGNIIIANQGAGIYSNFQVTLISTGCASDIYNGTIALTESCSDFDSDGVIDFVDIDDDNDGLPDALESSNCFYNYNEIIRPLSVTTGMTNSTIANSFDNLLTTVAAFTAGNSQNFSVLELTPKTPVAITALEIEMNATTSFLPSTALAYQLQGWNGAGWINLTDSIQAPALTPASAGGKVTFSVNKNFNTYQKYRIFGTASATVTNSQIREVRFVINNYCQSCTPKTTCTVNNYQSLDSDGDGCSDALEGGATTSTNSNYSFPASGVGINGLADVLESSPESGIVNFSSSYKVYAVNNAFKACIDSDSDGAYDINDLDDDNDGILDNVEASACYYTAAEAIVISRITSELISVDDTQLDGDIQLLHNTTVETSGTAFNFNVGQYINGTALFIVKYLTPVTLTSLTLNKSVSIGASGTAVLQASNDSLTWTTVSSSTILSASSSAVFTCSNTSSFLFYRVFGTSSNTATTTGIVGEVTSILNTSFYFPAANPKPACSSDTDSDGIKNNLDLDTDGDGCADALEGDGGFNHNNLFMSSMPGGSTNVSLNLGNTIGTTAATNGVPTIANTGQGLSLSQNGIPSSSCFNSDPDNIPDNLDLDDDNDGVLDAIECPPTSAITYFTYGNTSGSTGPFPVTSSNSTYIFSALDATVGAGIVATRNATNNFLSITGVGAAGSTLAAAETGNDYIQYKFTTTADPYNWINAVQVYTSNIGITNSYHYAVEVSIDNFATKTILNSDITYVNGAGTVSFPLTAFDILPNTTYTFRVYFFNATASPVAHDDFSLKGYSDCDLDGDGVPNRLDLDSDGDGCPDLAESGVLSDADATFSSGNLINTSGTINKAFAVVNGLYGNNGFAASIETNDLQTAGFTGAYTYSNATNSTLNSGCNAFIPNGGIVGGSICQGQNGFITFNKTNGTGPFKLVINGVTYNNITSGVPFNPSPLPLTTTIYNLTSITDSNNYSQP